MTAGSLASTDADPFAQGLARRLGERAAGTVVKPVPLAEIHARIVRRRRRRRVRVTVGVVMAVAFLVLTTTTIVGDGEEQEAATSGRDTMPLLGFANDSWTVARQSPGSEYAVVDGPGPDAVALIVSRDGGDPGAVRIERSVDRSIENMRGILQVGTVTIGDAPPRPAVWWAVAPGFTATVTGNAVGAYTDPTELLAATVELVEVDEPAWEERGGSSDDARLDARATTGPSPLW